MSELRRFFYILSFFLIVLNISQAAYADNNSLLNSIADTDSCLTGFRTFTQGGWSSASNSEPGQIRDQYFDLVFPADLIVGGNFTLTLTAANAVMSFLPQGGTPYKFTENYIDPVTNTSAGVFGGQLVAAMMNYHYNLAGYLGINSDYTLGELIIVYGPFTGKTVAQLLTIANIAIGGGETEYTYSQISDALTLLNQNFNDGQDNGFLTCPPLPASIGDRVWFDTNRNGIQDIGESGIGGVTVELYSCNDILLATTTTAANGYYLFDNLLPGSYYIKFIKPANYSFTIADQGTDDSKDSDADPLTGKTICTALTEGEHDLTWDAGLYTTYASLGDRVWYDVNMNGIQDVGETGASGIVVRLFDCSDVLKNTTLTDQNGLYLFSNLLPGNYYVQFQLPAYYAFSPVDQGSDDLKDSDADPLTGKTICTTLMDDESDLSWDAGIYLSDTVYADLSLIKLVDNSSPLNGDIIKFTVKVSNDGPSEATNVKVIDVIPQMVNYLSYTASQGTYDTTTGLWVVGTLPSGAFATLDITVQVDINSSSNIIDLGPAKGFNLFILNDVNQPSSDTQGKMAVGRDAYLAGYSVGDMLPNSNGTVDVLIVGRDLTFISGAVYGGNVVYGNTTNLPVPAVSVIHGTIRQGNVIDFDAARIYLQTLSSQLAAMTVNGTAEFQWGTITLTGTDPLLNVFSIPGADISAANNIEINAPSGSVVLVNISGNNISWMGGLTVNGTDFTHVLYNFTESGQLNIHGIDIKGSILAPYTDVNFQAGVQHGQMIAKSLTGMGQFNLSFFMGQIPGGGIITNIAEVYFADQYDPDSTPNNGVETEDDYDKVVVTVGGSGGGSGNWNYVGTFLSGEMILALLDDNQGNMFAGTLGGKIYKSTDGGTSWVRINENMNAIYIWTLVKNSSGDLFAGTELGIFKSASGTDWNITSLSDKDVRTMKIDNLGNIFAGVWGYGVYKSADDGLTWLPRNSGLISVAVHSLTISGSSIYAATLDLGLYKSTDGGESWMNTSLDYMYVWSLGKTSAGTLFAGTYGNGLYRSTDNGDSWHKINNLVASFIYHIVVDNDNNIFVSSWTGGVFASSDNGDTWNGLGMPGARVSSLMANGSSSYIYAGTEDGRLFRSSAVTSVKNDLELPSEFSLMQNYPNPFNPSTVIRFNIPASGNYTIKMFNILGQEVRTLINGTYKPGKYSVIVDGSGLSSGIYFYSLNGDNVNITRKMILLK
jgi:choice-of-anchor A domain-containing protein/uncharacterized repeat protein (TIGR01451 family)